MPLKTTPLKVLIVDDERKACTNLRDLLLTYVDKDINIAGIAHDTHEAYAKIVKHMPDAVFLDIEMPNENAFHFLERIRPVNFEVVFVTAYDEYAVRAFKLNALDYILKPISISELRNAYEKVIEKIRYKNLIASKNISYIELANQVSNTVKHHKITLKDINTTEVVDFKDIYFVEAQSSYSRILFLKEHEVKEMILSSPLSDYEELLPADQFFRIHRSYLINCAYIKKIMNDGSNQVIMKNDAPIPVSRRRLGTLISFLKNNDYL
jgi:two-component system LytT family response regulator